MENILLITALVVSNIIVFILLIKSNSLNRKLEKENIDLINELYKMRDK